MPRNAMAHTNKYHILRYLSQMSHDILRENCILPVLEFLPTPGFWFVVMPRCLFLIRISLNLC